MLPVYGLILLGGVLRKTAILQREADKSLMRLVLNCLYPCLIITKMLSSEAVKDFSLVLWTLPSAFCIILIGLILSKLGGILFQIPKGPDRNTFSTTCGVQNYGFAAIPIVMALLPADSLGVLFVHSIGVEFAFWTLGIAFLQGKPGLHLKSLLSGPILAVSLGLILVYSGGATLFHSSFFTPFRTIMLWLGESSFTFALILVGASLFDELKQCIPTWRVASAAAILRLGILPAIILLITFSLPLPYDLKCILTVQAAMPSAVMPIVLSRFYGGSPTIASQVVLVTQGLGIFTIPLWITFGFNLLSPS